MAQPLDSTTETEPEDLIPSHPRLHPADILTGGFYNGRLAAVDVGVIRPAAAGAGPDCAATLDERKHDRMSAFTRDLEAAGINYKPFAGSCWARLHPSAELMLANLA